MLWCKSLSMFINPIYKGTSLMYVFKIYVPYFGAASIEFAKDIVTLGRGHYAFHDHLPLETAAGNHLSMTLRPSAIVLLRSKMQSSCP